MVQVNCISILTECAVDLNRGDFLSLNEEAQLQVTDEVLTGMLKFITDKYNSLDFGEIEKSAGNIHKFKYTSIIYKNIETLRNIYEGSSDPGASKYIEVCTDVMRVMDHLAANANDYETLYKSGNGIIQLLYTSLVSGCVYSVGTLVSNTIRFVTTEKNTDCEVLFDEIPGTIKHVHIKNIHAAAYDLEAINSLLVQFRKPSSRKVMAESVTFGAVAMAVVGIGAAILLIPRIIVLIREIIYSVYFTRVKTAEMLQVQIDLVNTNIESLEAGRGSKKVIAKQKKVVDNLTKWKNRIAVKMDTANTLVAVQKKKENTALRVDRNSPIVQDPGSFNPSDIML